MEEEPAGASTRREMLKATGAVAAGAAGFFAAASVLGDGAGAVVDALGVSHIPTSITLSIDGKALGKVNSVGVTSQSVDVVVTVDPTGVTRRDRGRQSTNNTLISRTFDGDQTFRTWFAGAPAVGSTTVEAITHNVTLTLRGRQRSVISRLTLTNAWPTSWTGPKWIVPEASAKRMSETVSLVCDSWKLS